jgi:putative transposase
VKYDWIASNKKYWSVSLACEMLDVSTSGYFEHMRRKGADKPSKPVANKRISNEALLAHIRAIYPEVKQKTGLIKYL